MTTSRVFLFEDVNFNISRAKEYGKLITLFPDGDARPSVFQHEEIKSEVLKRLDELEFNPELDLFLVVGTVTHNLLPICFMLERYRRVRVLLFHSISRDYVVRSFST